MKKIIFLIASLIIICSCSEAPMEKGLKIVENDNQYFYYNGHKTLLLGGSNEDNLFQNRELWPEIDSMAEVGGNYLRCTMSSRDSGNIWAFRKEANGLYNLRKFNPEYWNRLDGFIRYCSDRDVIVQIEVWATFDFHKEFWQDNPFNPKNNRNYDEFRSKLDSEFSAHPAARINDFYRSVPSQLCTPVLLGYQQAFVDKLLSHSLKYDNVLYCIDNETSANSDWAKFWALYIKDKALYDYNKTVYVTEMWDPWDLSHPLHAESFFNPEIFDFVEISQNNHNSDYQHWLNGIKQIEDLKKRDCFRPVTNIKVYGADGGRHQTTNNAIESYVRNVLMGAASTRFHRPTSGLGWGQIPSSVIKSIRLLEAECDLLNGEPDTNGLSDIANEIYLRKLDRGEKVWFIPGQSILNISGNTTIDDFAVLDILSAQWVNAEDVLQQKDDMIRPNKDYIILLKK